jgi:hypothetical protein
MRIVGLIGWAYLAGIAAFGLAACRPATKDPAVDNGSEKVLPLPTLPVAEAPMDREALLLAVAKAASSAGLGLDDVAAQRKLDGRRFEVRIRFGCEPDGAAADADGRFSVRFDEKDRTLRLRASPDLGLDDAPVDAPGKTTGGTSGEAKTIEAVEGFWIRRPWLLADGCPATSPPDEGAMQMRAEASRPSQSRPATAPGGNSADAESPSTEANERVGLAEFYTNADSRTGRRDERAYEVTKVLGEGEQTSTQGYNLVLSGRLRAQPLGRVISCSVATPGEPPRCIVSAQLDRVLIERPDSKQILANWGS